MPEKQICRNCKHRIKQDEQTLEWLHCRKASGLLTKMCCSSNPKEGFCDCHNPEPQILCGKCGKEIEQILQKQFKGEPIKIWVHKKSQLCICQNKSETEAEPQILCGKCGKPKGEHILEPYSLTLLCSEDELDDRQFEPARNHKKRRR